MKILWIVNTIFPFPADKIGIEKNYFGGWLNGLANCLKNNESINLAIATLYNGKKILKFCDDRLIYYLIPNIKKQEKYWIKINEIFNPDIIHIHGTEMSIGLNAIN